MSPEEKDGKGGKKPPAKKKSPTAAKCGHSLRTPSGTRLGSANARMNVRR